EVVGAAPAAEPEVVGGLAVPRGGTLGAGHFEDKPVLPAGGHLRDVERAADAVREPQEHGGVVVGRDVNPLGFARAAGSGESLGPAGRAEPLGVEGGQVGADPPDGAADDELGEVPPAGAAVGQGADVGAA